MARLTPQQKKRLAYQRDHRVQAEYPHLFRKGWPKRKAIASRRERRRADRLLEALSNRPADAVLDEADVAGLTAAYVRDSRVDTGLWRNPVLTLREHVADRKESRVRTAAFRFFKSPYDAGEHRSGFGACLAAVVAGSGEGSRAMAAHLADLLDPEPRPGTVDWRRRSQGEWLRAFFRDEPAWEPRLRAWMERVMGAGE